MPDPDIVRINSQFRAALLVRERAAASEMVRAYGQIWQRIQERLKVLTQEIVQLRAAGVDVPVDWLFQRSRLPSLLAQVEAEIRQFAPFAESRILVEENAAVQAAMGAAEQLMLAGLGPGPAGVVINFRRLPIEALQDLIGVLQDGSPLRDLLDALGPEASQAVRAALIRGLALGSGAQEIAREVRKSLAMGLSRALTIARTEVIRAYRESSRRMMEVNSRVVKGWIWASARDRRTCVSCWAMHGSRHSLTERLDDHPSGRCTMIPETVSWEELGYAGIPDNRPVIEPGPVVFARLSPAQQLNVLGPAKFAAYSEGAVTLPEMVKRTRDPRWGTMRSERSLEDIVGATAAREYLQKGLDLAGKLAEAA